MADPDALANAPDRNCNVRRDGGNLVVRLTVDNLVAAGGHFQLNTNDNQVLEEWEMQPGAAGTASHTLSTSPARLDGCFIQWRIRVCSMNANVDNSNVTVEVLQDGSVRPMVPPASYHLPAVPQCSSGNASQIDDFTNLTLV
jgi:hypothetical protein